LAVSGQKPTPEPKYGRPVSMHKIFQELNSGKGWDWCISSFDGCTLNFSAGTAIEYSRLVVKVQEVSYLNCPIEFSHPIFRQATLAERAEIAGIVPLEEQDIVVAIEAETMAALLPSTFFIVGQSWSLAAKD
jgi:hypothetical protein